MKNKIGSFQLILYMVLSSIFFMIALLFQQLVSAYKNMAWLYSIIGFVIPIILFSVFKASNQEPFEEIKKHKIVKYVTIVYIIISTVLMIVVSSVILKKIFYQRTPIIFFIVLTALISSLLGFQSFKCIVDTSTIFFTTAILIYILPLILSHDRDLILLLPINFDKPIYTALLLMYFPLDNALFAFFNSSIKGGLKKKHLIISSLILVCYFVFILVDSLSLLGSEYLATSPLGGFYRWGLFEGNKFFENNDILLLYISLVSVFYRIALHMNLLKQLTNIKKKPLPLIIVVAVFALMSYLMYNFYDFFKSNIAYLLCYMILSLLVIYTFFIYIQRRKKDESEL